MQTLWPYEVHLTVPTSDVEKFKEACIELRIKPIILDLQKKKSDEVIQDFMTSSLVFGDKTDAFKEVKRLTEELNKLGLEVIRSKVETAGHNPLVKSKDLPKDTYFESHIQVVIRNSQKENGDLKIFDELKDLHLSRNPFKVHQDSYVQMITYRSYSDSYEEFGNKVCNFVERMEIAGLSIPNYPHIEFCIYDSNVHHDSEWLNS